MRAVALRRRLFLLVATAILPLAAMSGIGLLALANQQRHQAEEAAIEITRALATAVDAELRRSISVLETLATSIPLDKGDVAAFSERAQRVRAVRSHWLAVLLYDRAGQPLLHTSYPFGAPLPPANDEGSLAETLRTRQPSVGALVKGPRGNLAFAVRVPVVRDSELRYVLSAIVRPEAIHEIVLRQRVPPEWVISVFDSSLARVARSRLHAESLGAPPSPSLVELMKQGGEQGSGVTHSLEGERIYTAFTRSSGNGWSVAIGIPAGSVEAGGWRSGAVFGGGILLSIALGAGAALLIASRIARPIGDLRAAAHALGRGAPLPPFETAIREIRDVGSALSAAAASLARAKEEREDLLQREQQARAAAEAANRAKDEFLAMLGHELRNPLGAISNATRLLEHPGTSPEAATQAQRIIARQVAHLARMTDDLLDAGRAVMGKIALHRQSVDLAEAAASALATLKPRTDAHCVVADLRPVWVDADPTRLEQIVSNLVVNAVKYTPAGGELRVSVGEQAGQAVFRVSDDGIGMPSELAGRAFELFVQGDRDLDRAHGGLGIGLTLVRRLAELHGGSAQAASAGPGRGSEFTVRLPAIAAPAPARQRDSTTPTARARRILVVEDNDDAREMLVQMLSLSGHSVRAARDGEQGLRSALAEPPEVALVDIGLPKLNGYELVRRLRASAGAAKARPYVVALTGYGLPEDRERALAAGFDTHLVKPVELAELERLLSKVA